MSAFLSFKALHLIFVVSWFAGLFYIVRLFIYHIEAFEKEEPARTILIEQYRIMQKRLWWIITTPAMVLTLVFGGLMLWKIPVYMYTPWMHVKLLFVGLLVIYHFLCQGILFQLAKGATKWTSNKLRIWNEVATLFLVAIIFIVVYKQQMNWLTSTAIFIGVAITLMIAIKIYKRIRTSKTT